MTDYGKNFPSVVYSIIIKIKDVEGRAKKMFDTISNTSWLNELKPVEKATFKARSQRSITKMCNLIINRAENEVTKEFGEFMISESAQTILQDNLGHIKVPLAELLKEKISGNPGFDFHTESSSKLISFGEAKYSAKIDPHQKAITQIVDFIKLEKDTAELAIIQNFVSKDAIDKSLTGQKAYVVAFSINSKDPKLIISKALSSNAIESLLTFPELFVIGVQVDA